MLGDVIEGAHAMTEGRDLKAKADQFAAWAARARLRTLRNAYLSLERTCRALAAAAEKRGTLGEHPANPH